MEDKSYEEMSLEELKKLKEEIEKKKLIEEIRLFTAVEDKPDNPIENEGESVMSNENAPHMKVLKRFQNIGISLVNYENDDWIYQNDADSGCEDDVSDWSPEDVYANIIWGAFTSDADLLDITVKGLNVKQGEGMTVKVRAFGSIGSPTKKGSCETGSCASITFSTYNITIEQYNLEAVICDRDIWDAGSIVLDSYLKAMADSWKEFFNLEVYKALKDASPGTSITLPTPLSCEPELSGSCCTDSSLVNLYNSIINIVASMRENKYKPDYIIMSPSVAAVFKRMQTPRPVFFNQVEFDSSGKLSKISGLNVIEYEDADSCATSGGVMAVIIDSRRAVGAAFGKKPVLYKFFLTDSNAYRLDMWAYFGVSALDSDAIAHIINP